MYTLSNYYSDAGVANVPEWGDKVVLPFKPYQHQVTGLSQALYWNRYNLLDDMGVGKTLISQAFAIFYAWQGNKVICLMPPVLLQQYWESFHTNFKGIDGHVKVKVFRGTKDKRFKMLDTWEAEGFPDVLLMTYDIFRGNQRNGTDRGTSSYFKDKGYNVLVSDEATVVKTASSRIHKTVAHFLGKEDESALLLMTGSPAENNLRDLYGLIKLVTPSRYTSQAEFDHLHCVFNPDSDYEQVVAFKNLDILRQNLYSQGRRVTKEEVLDLPPKIITEVPVDLDPAHLALYKRLVKERMLELEDGVIIDAITAQSLRQKMQRVIMTPELFTSKPKYPNNMVLAVDELLRNLNLEENKAVVFGHYNATIQALTARYSRHNPAVVYGQTNNRYDELDKFKEDPGCRLMLASYRSAGVGLDLQDQTNYVIFVESVSVPGWWHQACDRVYRGGQTKKVFIYVLVARKTVSVTIKNTMMGKDNTNNLVVGGKASILKDLMGGDDDQEDD